MKDIADALATQGRKAYVIPGGGSNPLGALGYVACAEEILAKTFDLGLRIDHIVCASGSTGTHAGLLAGLVGNNSQIPVTGINVRRTRQEQEPNVHVLAQETARLLGIGPIAKEAVTTLGDWVGPGYSLPTPEINFRVDHAFSKRTAAYLTAARINNEGAATRSASIGVIGATPTGPGESQTAVMIGLRHSF